MKNGRFVYLAVTADRLSLPIAAFDNPKQIAKYAETTYKTVCCMICRKTYCRRRKCYFIKVDLEANYEK